MKCVLVAIGWENISLQALSGVLKENGHEVELVYDQALFDDKNYLKIDWLARIFDQKDMVLQRIIELQPDLVGFHVMTVQYQEMRELAARLKRYYNVPVLFGGIHPHSAPESVLLSDDPTVDMVCLGEGEYPLLDLCNSIDQGKIDYSIKNLWFRLADGHIIKNEMRPVMDDLDALPPPDKELFAPHVPLHYSYLSCPSRGCPYKCNFCSLSFLGAEAEKMGAKRVRDRSVDSLIEELKLHIKQYKSPWIDFRQPVMAASEKWSAAFFTRYKEEIGLPFRCFLHPQLVTESTVRAMRDAGCFAIQIGIECWDEEIRVKILNRKETNEQIKKAAEILERTGQPYAFDYILGIPRLPKTLSDGTTQPLSPEESMASIEKELMSFADFISPLKHLYRVAPFMLQYMPGTEMIEHGLNAAEISPGEAQRIDEGHHGNYMAEGSIGVQDEKRLKTLNGYRVLFRLMSFLSPAAKKRLISWGAHKILWMAPFRMLISLLDILIAVRDKDATTYARNYLWWFLRRFDKNYHLYMFKKRTVFPEVAGGLFQLPLDGELGSKNQRGWRPPSTTTEAAKAA